MTLLRNIYGADGNKLFALLYYQECYRGYEMRVKENFYTVLHACFKGTYPQFIIQLTSNSAQTVHILLF